MNSQQRRQQLLVLLRQNSGPVSATAIAKEFGVSRQIIVGDVALLRAAGEQISATPRGYVLKQEQNLQTRTIACRHDERLRGAGCDGGAPDLWADFRPAAGVFPL